MRFMAAARARAALLLFRAKNPFPITVNFLPILITHRHESTSASLEFNLLQKLIDAPDSRVKVTLESECPSDSYEFPWPSLVTSLHSSSPHKATLVLQWKLDKLRKGEMNSENSYIELLSLCERIGNLQIALLIFTSLEAQGTKPRTSFFNSLISTSLLSGNLLTALSLFELMERSEYYKPDSSTYDAFIGEYSKLKDFQAVESWLSAKRDCGFLDDAQMYDSLIQCCTKLNKFKEAELYYEEMVSAGLILSESIFNNMVKVFYKTKNFTKVKEILKASGSCLNENNSTRIVRMFQQQGLVQEFEQILEFLKGIPQNGNTLSLFHSSIISMYSESDRVDDVEMSVKRMLDNGISFSCTEVVEKVIDCYFRNEAYDKLELFLESIKNTFKLKRSTYDLLCSGYKIAGLNEKMNAVANDMKLVDS